LPKGYFAADKANAILDIANVSDKAGNVINNYSKIDLAVVDTKAPTLASAKLTAGDKLVLEFSEAISTDVSGFDESKVVIKQAGNVVTGLTTGALASVNGKEVTITLDSAAGKTVDLSKAYTVSVEAGVGLVDQAGLDTDAIGNEVSPFTGIALVDGVAPVLTATDIFADASFDATNGVIGVTAPAISTTEFAVAKSALSEVPVSVKLVYSDLDANTADVVVNGTIEVNAAQNAYTYSFGAANLSSQTAGTLNVGLVLVDANGNSSTAYNVVTDGTGSAQNTLTLVK
jgi:hypothetical protein